MSRLLFFGFFLYLCLAIPTRICAQYSLGVINSNNGGIMSAIANPANIADSRFWMDIHISGASVDFNQNLLRTRFGLGGYLRNDSGMQQILPRMFLMKDIQSKEYLQAKKDLLSSTNFDNSSPQGVYVLADILGPSVMFNLFKRIGFGISTRARAQVNILDRQRNSNFAANYEALLAAPGDRSISQTYDMENFKAAIHRFAELDMTFATPIMDKGVHFLKAGLTVKRLVGYDYGVFTSLRTSVNFKSAPNSEITLRGKTEGSVYRSPYKNNGIGDYVNYFFGGVFGSDPNIPRGWGFDLGFVYEFRPNYEKVRLYNASVNTTKRYIRRIEDYTKDKYKFKWSIALRDFGYIRYGALYSNGFIYDASERPVTVQLHDPKATLAEVFSGRYQAMKREFDRSLTTANYRDDIKKQVDFYLPANFITQIDWTLNRNFYLNATFIANLMTRHAFDTRMPTILAVAPRYEGKYFDMSMPVIYNFFYNQLKVGLGMNIYQIFYIGTDDIAFAFGGFRGLSFYSGFRMPFRKLKPFFRIFDNTKKYNQIYYNDTIKGKDKIMRDPIPVADYKAVSNGKTSHRTNFENSMKRQNAVQNSNFSFREQKTGSNVQSMQRRKNRRGKSMGL